MTPAPALDLITSLEGDFLKSQNLYTTIYQQFALTVLLIMCDIAFLLSKGARSNTHPPLECNTMPFLLGSCWVPVRYAGKCREQ